MNNSKAKKGINFLLILSLLAGMVITTSIPAFAGDGNHDFSFKIPALSVNGQYGVYRYRTSCQATNKWKVNLRTSGEGAGTVTRFWLTARDGQALSITRNAKQGAGAYYTNAYTIAGLRNVYLSGDNNNVSTSGYNVSGYWDEES